MEAIPVPLHKFLHVHMDLVVPWPWTTEGHTHLLTAVDRTSRWADAIPLQSTTAQVVADSFVANWVARLGVPATITMDQGTQSTDAMWQCMCKVLGDRHMQTTAYQRYCGGLPLTIEGGTTCQVQQSRLAEAPPLGSIGPTCNTKGGGRCVSS